MTSPAVLRRALGRADSPENFTDLTEALGFDPVVSPIDFMGDPGSDLHRALANSCRTLHRVGTYATGDGSLGLWVATLPEGELSAAVRERCRRRIAKTIVELAPANDRLVLLALLATGSTDIELVLPRVRDGALGTVRALISRSETEITRHHLELLEEVSLPPGFNRAKVARRWASAFDVEKVTKEFYQEFKALRDRVVSVIAESNPGDPRLNVPKGDEEGAVRLRRFVARNLNRVLFLWFLQAKGWLNKDKRFLVNLYGQRCSTSTGGNFFRDALIPLFFEALAKKPENRSAEAKALGDLPFLNGGLFLPNDFEDELYGINRENLTIELPNTLFDPRQHSDGNPTVLGLFGGYRFTTRESTPDDQSVDPDPELLGKVFENLNETRKKTGTFYTPREVVRFMCRSALDGYLRDRTSVTDEVLHDIREEAKDPTATDRHLNPDERQRLTRALDEVTVCDPAVGSGAFPVGMLQEILQLRIGIEQSADVKVAVGGQRVAEWKLQTITRSLYGVDINPEAAEICHLRLWLSLVIDADNPLELPNLDFRFEAGDSLIDRFGKDGLLESFPRGQAGLPYGELVSLETEIAELRNGYAVAKDPSEARRLREVIRTAQLKAVALQLDSLLSDFKGSCGEEKARLAMKKRLRSTAAAVKKQNAIVENLEEKIAALEEFRAGLSPSVASKKPFLWPVEYPEVFENGGFDIVVANPPYVRQEKLAALDQEAYQAAFPEVYSGTADLLVFFFARAIQVLKPGGHLAFITSNKFHRAGYGEGIRKHLPATLLIDSVIDFGDLPLFDAIAYPSVLLGKRANGATDPERAIEVADLSGPIYGLLDRNGEKANVATVRPVLEDLEPLLDEYGHHDYPQGLLRQGGWVLEDPRLVRLFERLRKLGTPFGRFVEGRMYRGVLTGLNEAFVIDQATRDALIAGDPRSKDLLKPWLRGKDIKRWKANWAGLYVIFTRRGTDIKRYPAIEAHLRQWKKELTPKKTASQAGPGRKPGEYAWYEIQDNIAYYREFERPKILWPDMSIRPGMVWDESGAFVSNTVYMCPTLSWLVPMLNSTTLWFVVSLLAASIQGGFIRFFAQNVEMLPVVTPPPPLKDRLVALARQAVADPSTAEPEIDAVVESLYGLTPEESRLLADWRERHSAAEDTPVADEEDSDADEDQGE